MRFRPVSCVFLSVLMLMVASSSYSTVSHGTATLLPYYMPGCDCGWDQAVDFSAQTIVSKSSASADLAFEFTAQHGTPVWSPLHTTTFYYLTDTIESLLSVPATGDFYDKIQPTGTFVMKTSENLWVKFTVRGSTGTDVIIEYYLQPDGSRYFGPLLAVEPSTWGSVKALYR